MLNKLLIANRGEIAIRIARSASDMGIETVAIFSEDDQRSLHTRHADEAVSLNQGGVPAYLNAERVVQIAKETNCDAIHPGYGFLSESSEFAWLCEREGLCFVGPSPETLEAFGNKARARELADSCGVPILKGSGGAVSLKEARDFFLGLDGKASVMLKAISGGGGRGMRPVHQIEELEEAYNRATSEAEKAFGSGEIYVEALMYPARHIEVQIVGDGESAVHLLDRECSLQRQRQKLIEIAPAFALPDDLRQSILGSATKIARASHYRGVGTIEFLVRTAPDNDASFVFMEANPRLQVEHTVTEEVTGLDLVELQLRLAEGENLRELGLEQIEMSSANGVSVQVRINLEKMNEDGTSRPGGGTLSIYEPPSGPGVRVDGFGYSGYATSVLYDSLLAKLIVHSVDLDGALRKARRALSEFKVEGSPTNIEFLESLLGNAPIVLGGIHTSFVEENIADLLGAELLSPRYFEPPEKELQRAGSQIDSDDPLAVLSLKGPVARAKPEQLVEEVIGPPGTVAVLSPLQGMIIELSVSVGDVVKRMQPVAVMEALKMEHVLKAEVSGVVKELALEVGDTIFESTPVLFIEPQEGEGDFDSGERVDLDSIRADVAEINHFHGLTKDEARVEATKKRHEAGKRTARENILDLCDSESFFEYGSLVTAARYRNDTPEELEERVRRTAADAMVMGVGRVNEDLVGQENARCIAMSYDYSVLAGTQGTKNHQKQDRMFGVAEKYRLPVVLYTEGGGGRTYGGPRSDSGPSIGSVGGLNVRTWRELGKLSGLVPLVGVNSGYCFAGNVVLLGACDVIIATKDSSLGIGGPALIEGGGLGAYAASEVGPVSIQEPNGVIDILVEDEVEATRVAKHYLSFFQGRVKDWKENDQRILRNIVPENRRSVYSVRTVIETLADSDSMLELRPRFGLAMVTAFIRIEGRAVGVIANNSNSPTGGAIDSDAADKAARFMQLCDAFDIPILSLVDTPGNMVGPEAEKTALIRHCGRMYVAGANISVPFFLVVLRKSYGLGALAMATGSFDETFFSISWPTGEFAGMGLEGQVKLGRRAELAAIEDLTERKARYDKMVADAYAWSRALNAATVLEVDDVIDPVETRSWLAMGLNSLPPTPVREGKKRGWVDAW